LQVFKLKLDRNLENIKILITIALQFEANHNKDYSVVKTFKAGQLAFFFYLSSQILYNAIIDHDFDNLCQTKNNIGLNSNSKCNFLELRHRGANYGRGEEGRYLQGGFGTRSANEALRNLLREKGIHFQR